MKTVYVLSVIVWIGFLSLYSGIVGVSAYSEQTVFMWGGTAVNVTSHDQFTEFQLLNPLYFDTETNQVMKVNGTVNADSLSFRFSEGQVIDYVRVYNNVYFPYLHDNVERQWDEYTVDGEPAFTTRTGINSSYLLFGLWGITFTLGGIKLFQDKRRVKNE